MSGGFARWPARSAALVVASLAVTVAARAATPTVVTATPGSVARGQVVTVRGAGWGVIEFCRPRVTLTLQRSLPLKALVIGRANLRTGPTTSGTFTTTWTVPRSIHRGLRTIVVTQRCESGKNGALVLITRTAAVSVT